jgi:hypothetical protein
MLAEKGTGCTDKEEQWIQNWRQTSKLQRQARVAYLELQKAKELLVEKERCYAFAKGH